MFQLVKKNHDLFFLMNSVLISKLGTWFTYMLMIVAVYNETKDTLFSMVIVGAQAIAGLIGGQIAGLYVEKRVPKRVLIRSDYMSAILIAGVFFLPFNAWLYSGAAFLIAFVSAFRNPAFQKYLVVSVSEEERMSANGSFQIINELVKIIGPALAVSVLAVLPHHLEKLGFVIDAFSYLIAAVLLIRIKSLAMPAGLEQNQQTVVNETRFQKWKAGLSPLKDPIMLNVMIVFMLLLFGVAGCDIMLTAHISESGYNTYSVGYVVGSLGLGILLTSALAVKYVQKMPLQIQLGLSSLFLGISYTFIGIAQSLPMMIFAAFAMGVFNAVYNMSSSTFMQKNVPYEVMERFFGFVGSMAATITLIGMGLNGLISKLTSAGFNIMLCGILISLAGLTLMVNLNLVSKKNAAVNKETA